MEVQRIPSQNTHPVFKLIIVGEGSSGKSTFAGRFISSVESRLLPQQASVRTLAFQTSVGPFAFEVWDTMGQENAGGTVNSEFYKGSHCAILMFDLTSRESYKKTPDWYREISYHCQGIPIVMVGNKADSKNRKVKPRQICFHRKKNIMYYEVSALGSFRIEKPYEWLMKKLAGNGALTILGCPHLKPCEIPLDLELIQDNDKELEKASNTVLPDDDDDEISNSALLVSFTKHFVGSQPSPS